ncbi:MAG: hypothetical protein LBJ89_01935, partial [Holosporales bacterium]|nr:hypothetical protein [Holosporales bacterium]
QWQTIVGDILTHGPYIDLTQESEVPDLCCITSPEGASYAAQLLQEMLNASNEEYKRKAIVILMIALNEGGLSEDQANTNAMQILTLIREIEPIDIEPNDIKNAEIEIKWLRYSLHTEVQLLLLLQGDDVPAPNTLLLSLKEPCKSCMQTPILRDLKNNYNCYFVSTTRDMTKPLHREYAKVGLKQYRHQPTPITCYVSIVEP